MLIHTNVNNVINNSALNIDYLKHIIVRIKIKFKKRIIKKSLLKLKKINKNKFKFLKKKNQKKRLDFFAFV